MRVSNSGLGNGKAALDHGYGMFLNILEYKLANRVKCFVKVKVDKWFPSSQICSKYHEMKNLANRGMKCEGGL